MIERQQRQFAPAALPPGRPKCAGPVQHGGNDAEAVHPHPGPSGHAVPPGDGAGMVGPPRVRRVPGAVQPFIAINGEQGKGRADENNNSAHEWEHGVWLGEKQASECSLKTIDSYKKLCDKRIRNPKSDYWVF